MLDLYCAAGGAAVGLHNAGFEVVGVDLEPQPNYPFKFIQADVLTVDLDGYDAYWASPPCQAYTWAAKCHHRDYPDLMGDTRDRLLETGKPCVIENVIGAPMRKDLMLCGEMFNLGVIRHRIFEIHGFSVPQPEHRKHQGTVKGGQYVTVAGHGGDGGARMSLWSEAMGIDWMTKKELTQAVPPKYAEYVGRFMFEALTAIPCRFFPDVSL